MLNWKCKLAIRFLPLCCELTGCASFLLRWRPCLLYWHIETSVVGSAGGEGGSRNERGRDRTKGRGTELLDGLEEVGTWSVYPFVLVVMRKEGN
jgi:hypothetical protein